MKVKGQWDAVGKVIFIKPLLKSFTRYLTAFRFEEEILTSQKVDDVNGDNSADSKVIIGSGTFDRVQTQLNSKPAREPEAAPVTTAAQKPDSLTTKPRLTFSGVFVCVCVCLLTF